MTINEVKKHIDKIVADGYGDFEAVFAYGADSTIIEEISVEDDVEQVFFMP